MTEKTKPQKNDAPAGAEEKPETGDNHPLSGDRREKSYYYDDACGYEVYNPDDEDEED
ncbi:MAG TPA: hypothetical protein VK400_10840 [Pyrinomonadaceae bacterium]|nr:hypothetical protein [Pyrinomonadaceae bacterium]